MREDDPFHLDVALWNIGGGPSGTKLDRLAATGADVLILLEVSQTGSERLARRTDLSSSCSVATTRGRSPRRRLAVAIVGRNGWLVEAVLPSPIAVDDPFAEQFHAVRLCGPAGQRLAVAGFHAPNAAVRGQADKERLFELVTDWANRFDAPTILGVDTNTWTSGLDKKPKDPRPHIWHQERFQMAGTAHGLVDAYCAAAKLDPELGDDDAWWTYDTGARRCRMDQIWTTPDLIAVSAWTSREPLRRSHHRMLGATLRASPPTDKPALALD